MIICFGLRELPPLFAAAKSIEAHARGIKRPDYANENSILSLLIYEISRHGRARGVPWVEKRDAEGGGREREGGREKEKAGHGNIAKRGESYRDR